jgi:hypothetical protein
MIKESALSRFKELAEGLGFGNSQLYERNSKQLLVYFPNDFYISAIEGPGTLSFEGTVEVAVFHGGSFVFLEEDKMVEGWVDEKRFIEILKKVSELST